VLEINSGDAIRDAIHMLYEKDTFGAVIVDVLDTETASIRFSDRYIGFISFPNMVLWCLEVFEYFSQNLILVTSNDIILIQHVVFSRNMKR